MAKKRKHTRKKRFPYIRSILIALLIGTASWAIYSMVNRAAGDILTKIGIENFYYQMGIVIIVIILLLMLVGFSIKKSLDKVLIK